MSSKTMGRYKFLDFRQTMHIKNKQKNIKGLVKILKLTYLHVAVACAKHKSEQEKWKRAGFSPSDSKAIYQDPMAIVNREHPQQYKSRERCSFVRLKKNYDWD